MSSYFKGRQCNIPCLAHPLPAAQQWRRPRSKGGRPRSGTACHNFQHAAPGCSPVNLKNCQGRPTSGGSGPAGLGGMGGAGVAIESGCCRSTGRGSTVSELVKGTEPANVALNIQAQCRPFGPLNWNQMKHRMRHRMRHDVGHLRHRRSKQRTSHTMRAYDIVGQDLRCRSNLRHREPTTS